MYAVFQSGGKQYKAEPGRLIRLEKLSGVPGDRVVLDQVLLVADGDDVKIGRPLLEDTAITAKIVAQERDRKIIVFKHKRRKDYRKKQGHRQALTAVLVEAIGPKGQEGAAPEIPEG